MSAAAARRHLAPVPDTSARVRKRPNEWTLPDGYVDQTARKIAFLLAHKDAKAWHDDAGWHGQASPGAGTVTRNDLGQLLNAMGAPE